MSAALLLAAVLAVSATHAGDTPLYTGAATPWTLARGQGTAGLFHPATLAVTDQLELTTTGLFSLVAPRLEVKHTAASSEHWGLGLRAGLGTPTPALRLSQGMLVPSNVDIPWTFVVAAGPVLGWRGADWNVSLVSQVRFAIPPPGLPQLDMRFGLDALLTPLYDGWCVLERLVVDWHPGEAWVFTGEAGVQLNGGPDWRWRLFALRRLGRHTALGAGWWLTSDVRSDGERMTGSEPLADFQIRW